MDKIYILHNNRCSKSRETCNWMLENIPDFEIIDYLETPPSKKELSEILKKLGIKAQDLVRKKEPVFLAEYKGKNLTESEWIAAMIAHPKLIERPIVIKGDQAAIGRPLENVIRLLQ